jgi:hypothetical protein
MKAKCNFQICSFSFNPCNILLQGRKNDLSNTKMELIIPKYVPEYQHNFIFNLDRE